MADKYQEYEVVNENGKTIVRPKRNSSGGGWIEFFIFLGGLIVGIWKCKPVRYAILIILACAFVIAFIMTSVQYTNKGIPVTDLVMTDSANASWVTKSGYTNTYEADIPDGTYLEMTSRMEDGKSVVARATFQNQEDRKVFNGCIYYFQPTHVEQTAMIRVYVDGKLAYESGALGRDWHYFDVSIDGASEIRIEAHCTDSELNYYNEVVPARFYFSGGLN